MDTPANKSRVISPTGAIISGALCFGLAGLTFWSGVAGLMAGKTRTLGKGVHELIVKQDTPGLYWFCIAAHFVVALIVFAGAVFIFVSGCKRIRRG
jgi:hypothetical protein